MQKKILIYDDNPFHAKMSSQFRITADPRHRVAQITQLLIITSYIVKGSHDSILGSVTCWTRKFRGRILIGALETSRIAKTLSNDDTVPQSVVAWKNSHGKKKEKSQKKAKSTGKY